jgi:hypothetical protein
VNYPDSIHVTDPNNHLDYTWDFGTVAAGDTVSTAVITPTTGITVSPVTITGLKVTAYVDATVNGSATCHATTASGRIIDSTKHFLVRSL